MTRKEELARFWDFVKAYVPKWHKFLWMLGTISCVIIFVMYCPEGVLPLGIVVVCLYVFPKAIKEADWDAAKIGNLIKYREITHTTFTPLEIVAIDRYFGNKQRKELVFDDDTKKLWYRRVWLLTFAAIVGIGVSAYFLVLYMLYPPVPEPTATEKLVEVVERLVEHFEGEKP